MAGSYNISDVMISYSRKDKEFVQKIDEGLKNFGRETWVDWDDIPPTSDWWSEIKAGIEAAHTFVFVISPDSVNSTVCKQEIDHAVLNNKRIIPILYREVTDESMHGALQRHNWVMMREQDDFREAMHTLINAIDTDLDHAQFHTRLLVLAKEWNDRDRRNSMLLRGDDLMEAEQWLSTGYGKQPEATALQAEFVTESRRAAQRLRRNVTLGMLAGGVLLSLLLCATVFALLQVGAQTRALEAQQLTAAAANATAEGAIVAAQDAGNVANDAATREAEAIENESIALTRQSEANALAETNDAFALTQEGEANIAATQAAESANEALAFGETAAAQATIANEAEGNVAMEQTAAAIAIDEASNAQTEAASVQEEADAAQAAADAARAEADAAQAEADAAQAEAIQIQAQADAAQTRAANDQADADEALDEAEQALDDAEEALDEAEQALDDAEDLLEDAEDALAEATEALIEADEALAEATEAIEQAAAEFSVFELLIECADLGLQDDQRPEAITMCMLGYIRAYTTNDNSRLSRYIPESLSNQLAQVASQPGLALSQSTGYLNGYTVTYNPSGSRLAIGAASGNTDVAIYDAGSLTIIQPANSTGVAEVLSQLVWGVDDNIELSWYDVHFLTSITLNLGTGEFSGIPTFQSDIEIYNALYTHQDGCCSYILRYNSEAQEVDGHDPFCDGDISYFYARRNYVGVSCSNDLDNLRVGTYSLEFVENFLVPHDLSMPFALGDSHILVYQGGTLTQLELPSLINGVTLESSLQLSGNGQLLYSNGDEYLGALNDSLVWTRTGSFLRIWKEDQFLFDTPQTNLVDFAFLGSTYVTAISGNARLYTYDLTTLADNSDWDLFDTVCRERTLVTLSSDVMLEFNITQEEINELQRQCIEEAGATDFAFDRLPLAPQGMDSGSITNPQSGNVTNFAIQPASGSSVIGQDIQVSPTFTLSVSDTPMPTATPGYSLWIPSESWMISQDQWLVGPADEPQTLTYRYPLNISSWESPVLRFESITYNTNSAPIVQISNDSVTWRSIYNVENTDTWQQQIVNLRPYRSNNLYVRLTWYFVPSLDDRPVDRWMIRNMVFENQTTESVPLQPLDTSGQTIPTATPLIPMTQTIQVVSPSPTIATAAPEPEPTFTPAAMPTPTATITVTIGDGLITKTPTPVP